MTVNEAGLVFFTNGTELFKWQLPDMDVQRVLASGDVVSAGEQLHINVDGFQANETVTVEASNSSTGQTFTLAELTTDRSGSIGARPEWPASDPGTYEIRAVGASSAASAKTAVDVAQPADVQAPRTTAHFSGNNWIEVDLTSVDDQSGVARVQYRLDGGDWTTYTGTFQLKRSDRQTLSYRATDFVGNVESTRCVSFAPGGGSVDVTIPPEEATC